MFMREENLKNSLDGICANCNTKQDIDFREELYLHKVYKVGCCPNCDYEHHIFVKKL